MKNELFYLRGRKPENYTIDELKTLIWRYFMSYWNNWRYAPRRKASAILRGVKCCRMTQQCLKNAAQISTPLTLRGYLCGINKNLLNFFAQIVSSGIDKSTLFS